jgi:hypothetical protein
VVTLWEEQQLRCFDDKIVRRVFGPKREYHGDWNLCVALDLHAWPDILRVIE